LAKPQYDDALDGLRRMAGIELASLFANNVLTLSYDDKLDWTNASLA